MPLAGEDSAALGVHLFPHPSASDFQFGATKSEANINIHMQVFV